MKKTKSMPSSSAEIAKLKVQLEKLKEDNLIKSEKIKYLEAMNDELKEKLIKSVLGN